MSAERRYRRQVARHRRQLWVLPEIPEDAPVSLKQAMAFRNEASRTGRCPNCGAELELDGPLEAGHVVRGVMRHEDGCSATDDAMLELWRQWRLAS